MKNTGKSSNFAIHNWKILNSELVSELIFQNIHQKRFIEICFRCFRSVALPFRFPHLLPSLLVQDKSAFCVLATQTQRFGNIHQEQPCLESLGCNFNKMLLGRAENVFFRKFLVSGRKAKANTTDTTKTKLNETFLMNIPKNKFQILSKFEDFTILNCKIGGLPDFVHGSRYF